MHPFKQSIENVWGENVLKAKGNFRRQENEKLFLYAAIEQKTILD